MLRVGPVTDQSSSYGNSARREIFDQQHATGIPILSCKSAEQLSRQPE